MACRHVLGHHPHLPHPTLSNGKSNTRGARAVDHEHRIKNVFDGLPPDLDRLHTLRVWHALWVERIDHKIAAVQRRQAEAEHGQRSRPEPPDWIVELGIGADRTPVQVHAGDCHMAGKRRRAVSRDEARRLLAAGLPGCTHCEPDVRLRMDDLESPAPTARRRRPPTTPADPPGSRLRTFVSSGGYPATEVTGARHPEQDPRCRLPHPRSANRTRPH
ncbi:DUF6233 domain-containing protein [Streptomyces sp. NPDC056468]|uniref:DUF6233 domain-containing protein n=1 Tax=Streptomyces sp. NPDC056468 TaxID=3345830 RepID=UPI0036766609